MGIYPERATADRRRGADGTESWVEIETTPGLIRRRVVMAQPWLEERHDCFCCSCGDRDGSDPYCRNHGFAGERPCELHGMPGKVDDEGKMPISLQAKRAR